jgi:hypothetical protein
MKTPYRIPLSLLLCVAIEGVFATEAPAQMPTPSQWRTTLQPSASGPSSFQLSRQQDQFTQLLLRPIRRQVQLTEQLVQRQQRLIANLERIEHTSPRTPKQARSLQFLDRQERRSLQQNQRLIERRIEQLARMAQTNPRLASTLVSLQQAVATQRKEIAVIFGLPPGPTQDRPAGTSSR